MNNWLTLSEGGYCRSFPGGAGMMIGGLLVIVLIGVVIYMAVQKNRGGSKKESQDDAVNIIKVRYANGDISREEYLKYLDDLK